MSTTEASRWRRVTRRGPAPEKVEWIEEVLEETPALLTIPEVAKILRRSTRSIERYIASGTLGVVQTVPGRGSTCLIPRTALRGYLYSIGGDVGQ